MIGLPRSWWPTDGPGVPRLRLLSPERLDRLNSRCRGCRPEAGNENDDREFDGGDHVDPGLECRMSEELHLDKARTDRGQAQASHAAQHRDPRRLANNQTHNARTIRADSHAYAELARCFRSSSVGEESLSPNHPDTSSRF